MKTTISFNHHQAKTYANNLFHDTATNEAYANDKKAEALLILVGLDTGLRVSDLLNLTFSNIDTSAEYGQPTLTAWVSKKKRNETKVLSTNTLRLLEVYKNYCILEHGTANDLIFFNYKNNKPYSRQWTHKRLNKANDLGKLGGKVETAGAHSLRRTAGANIYEKTNDLRTVQFLLGHDRMSQTEHYLKLNEKQALERLSKVFD